MTDFDRRILQLVNGELGSPILDPIMRLISSEILAAVLFAFLLIAVVLSKRKALINFLIVASLASALADIVSYRLMKPSFARVRPCHELANTRVIADGCGGTFSFPSNHASNAMAVAVVGVYFLRTAASMWLLLLPLVVGLSRVYLGAHYPSDVLAGFLLGGTAATLVYLFWSLWAGDRRNRLTKNDLKVHW